VARAAYAAYAAWPTAAVVIIAVAAGITFAVKLTFVANALVAPAA
jgi:hypothetical protein